MNIIDKPDSATTAPLKLYDQEFNSRLLLGTAGYPSPQIMSAAAGSARAEILTVSLRRENVREKSGQKFIELISTLNVKLLPNTAGCNTVKEAVTTAEMARELFDTPWIKLEVIANNDTLQPDLLGLLGAARVLSRDGFKVLPYCTEDLSIAEKLLEAGCEVLMPWGAPIGTGRGLRNPDALKTMRAYFPDTPLIIDAGLGAPSHATQAMEMGFDAVLLNTAVAKAQDPVQMARAFADATDAGRIAYLAGLMEPRDMAMPSTPVPGTPFI